MTLVDIARQWSFVREIGGQNKGLWVSLILRYVGITEPASWCAAFVCWCLGIYHRGNSPLIKSASCDDLLADCRKKGFIVTNPIAGDLVFSMNSETDAHHVAIATTGAYADKLTAIAGNTSADGTSSNGDRVAEHAVSTNKKVYARLPKAA